MSAAPTSTTTCTRVSKRSRSEPAYPTVVAQAFRPAIAGLKARATFRGRLFMSARNIVIAALAVGVMTSVASAQQRGSQPKAMTLTAQDYLDIQQLSNKYAFLIDTC